MQGIHRQIHISPFVQQLGFPGRCQLLLNTIRCAPCGAQHMETVGPFFTNLVSFNTYKLVKRRPIFKDLNQYDSEYTHICVSGYYHE